jgi:hypothetical protein
MSVPIPRLLLVSGAALAGVIALQPTLRTTAATVAGPRPQQTQISGSQSGAALLQVLNANSGGGAIIGQVGASQTAAAASTGLYGIFNLSGKAGNGVLGFASNGTGVVAEAYGGSYSAIFAQNYSSQAEPAIQGVSDGNAIVGTSADSNSIVGITDDAASGVSAAGILGEDGSTASPDTNVGVLGTTVSGAFGVEGTSSTSAIAGVGGYGTNGYGVYGNSATGDAIVGYASGGGDGVVGAAQSGYGLVAYSAGTGDGAEAFSDTAGGGVAYLGLASGEGGSFYGYSGSATYPALTAVDAVGTSTGGSGTDLIGTYTYNGRNPVESFIVQSKTLNDSGAALAGGSDVQISGDLYVHGSVYSECNAFPETENTDCDSERDIARSSTGAKLQTYAAQQSMKSIEDFGEAQLVNGQGFVPLEHTFASAIARDRAYLVFITPEGDSKGLYVTGKSPAGFTVRESQNGRSSIAFQYRIVAHPYADSGARLAAIAPNPHPWSVLRTRFGARVHRPASRVVRSWKLGAAGAGQRFAINRIPSGPPPAAEAASRQFRLR